MTPGHQPSLGPASAADAELGRVIGGRYKLLSALGAGASATVFLAEDLSLRRQVAVKLLHPGLVGDPKFRKRFRAEAQSAAQMSHPHLMAIHDWGDEDEAYLVTELLPGGSLRQMIDAARYLSVSQALVVGLHAAEGLAHAHGQGFVHRDIKPANLLFGLDGRLRVADFGIARAVAEAAWTEPEGALIGTARYAAPEQAAGSNVDGCADVYSLALTLIECVTGEVPLVEATPLATMLIRQDKDVPRVEELGPLADILCAAGRADRAERPSSVEFIQGLNSAAAHLPRPKRLPLVGFDHLGASTATATQVGAGFDSRTGEVDLRDGGSVARAGATTTRQLAVDGAAAPGGIGFPSIEDRMDLERTDLPVAKQRSWPWLVMVLLLALSLFGLIRYARGSVTDDGSESSSEAEAVAGATVSVGTFVGGTQADAERDLELAELSVEVLERRQDGTVIGEVLEQVPAAGTQVEVGSAVTLFVSLGPELRVVPSLVGMTLGEASLELTASQLRLGSITVELDEVAPLGSVIAVLVEGGPVEPGLEFESGSRIDLVLSDGPAPRTVPNLVGLSPEDATTALSEVGLLYAATEEGEYSEDVAEGLIVAMVSAAGSEVPRDSSVTVVLSRGLPYVQIPDVIGKTGSEAATILSDKGFDVALVDGNPNNEVIQTRPPIGESHRKGTSITIFTR